MFDFYFFYLYIKRGKIGDMKENIIWRRVNDASDKFKMTFLTPPHNTRKAKPMRKRKGFKDIMRKKK